MKRLLVGFIVWLACLQAATSASALDDRPGSLTFGAGVGFLGDTPDGTAFAVNAYLAHAMPGFTIGLRF